MIVWLTLASGSGCTPQAEAPTEETSPVERTEVVAQGRAAGVPEISSAHAEQSAEAGCDVAPPVEPQHASDQAAPPPPGPPILDGDRAIQRSPGGQWVAVCRPSAERGPQPRLIHASGSERPLDHLEATDDTGRFVLLTHAAHRWLLDTQHGHAHDLGPRDQTIPGSIVGTTLAYARRTDEHEQLVLHDALTHAERTWPSPRPHLHRIELDRSAHGLWLTTLDPDAAPPDDDPLDEALRDDAARSPQHMCATGPGCLSSSTAPRRLGLFWIDAPTPTFVELDETPARPRAIAGAVVLETDRGVELVYPDRRETIAEPGCRLDPEHYDPEVLRLRCEQDDARVRYDRWQAGHREPWTACGP